MTSKKGFAHIIPLFLISLLIGGGLTAASLRSEQVQKDQVGKVLSSSDDEDDDRSGSSVSGSSSSGSSGSGSSNSNDDDSGGSTSGSSSSGPGSSGVKVESRTNEGRTKVETNEDKTKIEVRNSEGRFETKVEDGKERTKIRTGGFKIEVRKEGDTVVTRIKRDDDQEVELEDELEDELFDELEDELEDDDIKIATGSAEVGFIQRGRRVRTNFPLSINVATGELIVSTPAGEKAVTVLPEAAIANMIAAGVLTAVSEPPTPPDSGTDSASVEGAGIELSESGGAPVFIIDGVKSERFLGLSTVNLKKKVVVSAENGELVDVRQGVFSRILDLLSF